MEIGFVTPSRPGGATANGIMTAVSRLAAGLKEAGHGVTIISLHPPEESDPAAFGPPEARSWSFLERLSVKLGRDVASAPMTEDPVAPAAACRSLLSDPASRARLGAAARPDVAERFAPRGIAEDVVGFLKDVTDGGKTNGGASARDHRVRSLGEET